MLPLDNDSGNAGANGNGSELFRHFQLFIMHYCASVLDSNKSGLRNIQ